MRSPVKVRFDGVPTGSSLARTLYHALKGPIERFYAKAAQAYSLNTVDQAGLHQDTDDFSIRYYNNQGHETLVIKVPAPVIEEILKQGFVPWDWALVNFKVYDKAYANMAAFMTVPHLQDVTPGLTRCQGVSFIGGTDGTGQKPMSFPDRDNPTEFTDLGTLPSGTGNWFTASLLVDLRIVDPRAAVAIDIYGNVEEVVPELCELQPIRWPVTWVLEMPPNQPISWNPDWDPLIDAYPWYVYGNLTVRWSDCTLSTGTFYVGSMDNNFGFGNIPATMTGTVAVGHFLYGPRLITLTATRVGTVLTIVADIDEPSDCTIMINYTPDTGDWQGNGLWVQVVAGWDNGWEIDSWFGGAPQITYNNPPETGGSPFTEDHWSLSNVPFLGDIQRNYNKYFAPYLPDAPFEPPEDEPAIMDVDGMIGMGEPDWYFAGRSNSTANYSTWERRGLFPVYPNMSSLDTGVSVPLMTGALGDISVNYGLTYLGQVIADRRYGAVIFKRA
jgi:hypothetical protein